jgi:L-ascorbate metabolism protein UlaG (beta-lactamase superfamily)
MSPQTFVLFIMVTLFSMGCSKATKKILASHPVRATGVESQLIRSRTIKLNYGYGYSSNRIKLKYLGAGGYFISNGVTSILVDPFFSPYGMVPMSVRKISTKPENVEAGLIAIKSDLYTTTKAIFVTHSHYDHLMDVPYVFNHFLDPSKAMIYGSESTKNIIKTVVDSTRIKVIAKMVGNDKTPGSWQYLSDSSIRIMPVHTEHAPHYNSVVSISLYGGQAEPINNYNSDLSKIPVTKWKKGDVYGYLIDFLDKQQVIFRIYLLSSASTLPNGMVHDLILKERPVDLAIIGAASFANVEYYPEGILEHIKPKKVLMTHWEDLFRPYLEDPPRFIRANNFKELIPRINKVYPWKTGDQQNLFFPYPGLTIEIYF